MTNRDDEMLLELPYYAETYRKRKKKPCYSFNIGKHILLEYWEPHEWEFSLRGEMESEEREQINALMTEMAQYMGSREIKFSRLPSLVAGFTARVTEYEKKKDCAEIKRRKTMGK